MSHSEFVKLLKTQYNMDIKITRNKVYISQPETFVDVGPYQDLINKLDFAHHIDSELSSSFNGTLLEAIQQSKLLPAVKEIRYQTSCTLYDAKSIYDYLNDRRYILASGLKVSWYIYYENKPWFLIP